MGGFSFLHQNYRNILFFFIYWTLFSSRILSNCFFFCEMFSLSLFLSLFYSYFLFFFSILMNSFLSTLHHWLSSLISHYPLSYVLSLPSISSLFYSFFKISHFFSIFFSNAEGWFSLLFSTIFIFISVYLSFVFDFYLITNYIWYINHPSIAKSIHLI